MINFLKKASDAYYSGNPIISDAEFDRLADLYNFEEVGHVVTDGIPHWRPMLSLQKVFDIEDAPFSLNGVVRTPKLDGAAVSLLYIAGNLNLALTRGDGKIGRDITAKMILLAPSNIKMQGIVQITGEVVAPSSIPNARNYASGALNLKDINEFIKRNADLEFVAYDLQHSPYDSYQQTLKCLADNGFLTVDVFDATNYPTDGAVYRVESNAEYNKMGATSHHPRGAFALKERKEGVVTTLLDVVWQVGKSGIVSPVAILEPILIGDALVSKATLHNIEYIRALDLEIGCRVKVIRSGEIIPRILERVEEEKNIS